MRARTAPKPVSAAFHSRVAQAAAKRAESLEDRLTDVLTPILERAGRDAARAFRAKATDHLSASAFPILLAAGGLDGVAPSSAMVCLKPRPDEADAVTDPGGAPAEYLHVTLVALGQIGEDALPALREALAPVAGEHAALAGRVGGYGEFQPPGCGILLPDVPGLVELRVAVTEALVDAGLDYARDHGYQPHITVDGSPEDGDLAATLERVSGAPLHFDALLVVRGDEVVVELPLVGVRPVTAAADPREVYDAKLRLMRAQSRLRSALESGDAGRIGDAKAELKSARSALSSAVPGSRWSAPTGDELIDARTLAQTLRTKTDPVRQRLVETTMRPSLAEAGLSFDVTNPLTAKALATTGEHITSISDTTRANVMRIVSAAHEAGLSIDDTAKAIRAGMAEAAPIRARMIARTELVGAINGGSLAATSLVQDVTGSRYNKTWRTAPGAPHPRHELYDGLDGQSVPLDQPFDVGGSSLMYPGDPDGDPGEVINCRCTMTYETPEGVQESSGEDVPDLEDAAASIGQGVGDAVAAVATLAPADVFAPIQGGTRGALVARRQDIESSLGDLAKVVALPDRANIEDAGLKITMRNNATSRGHIKYRSSGGRAIPVEINVSDGGHPAVTFAHEFGHLLDISYLGDTPGVFATQNLSSLGGELGDAMRALDEAWKDSASYRQLATIPDRYSDYFRSRKELWARSFSQWVGQRLGSGDVYDQVEGAIAREADRASEVAQKIAESPGDPRVRLMNRYYPEFWQPGDFDVISAAIERVLRAAGLLAAGA